MISMAWQSVIKQPLAPIKCEYCPYKSISSAHLQQHYITHQDGETFLVNDVGIVKSLTSNKLASEKWRRCSARNNLVQVVTQQNNSGELQASVKEEVNIPGPICYSSPRKPSATKTVRHEGKLLELNSVSEQNFESKCREKRLCLSSQPSYKVNRTIGVPIIEEDDGNDWSYIENQFAKVITTDPLSAETHIKVETLSHNVDENNTIDDNTENDCHLVGNKCYTQKCQPYRFESESIVDENMVVKTENGESSVQNSNYDSEPVLTLGSLETNSSEATFRVAELNAIAGNDLIRNEFHDDSAANSSNVAKFNNVHKSDMHTKLNSVYTGKPFYISKRVSRRKKILIECVNAAVQVNESELAVLDIPKQVLSTSYWQYKLFNTTCLELRKIKHNGRILFQCPFCEHCSYYKHHTKRHIIRSHSDQKQAEQYLKPNYEKLISEVQGRKPATYLNFHRCPFCHFSSLWSSSYRKHMKILHGYSLPVQRKGRKRSVINPGYIRKPRQRDLASGKIADMGVQVDMDTTDSHLCSHDINNPEENFGTLQTDTLQKAQRENENSSQVSKSFYSQTSAFSDGSTQLSAPNLHDPSILTALNNRIDNWKKKIFIRKPRDQKHGFTRRTVTQLRCPECSFTTFWKKNFAQHLLLHSELQILSCNKCRFVTAVPEELEKHEQSHELKRCEHCDFKTYYPHTLRRHNTRFHQPQDEASNNSLSILTPFTKNVIEMRDTSVLRSHNYVNREPTYAFSPNVHLQGEDHSAESTDSDSVDEERSGNVLVQNVRWHDYKNNTTVYQNELVENVDESYSASKNLALSNEYGNPAENRHVAYSTHSMTTLSVRSSSKYRKKLSPVAMSREITNLSNKIAYEIAKCRKRKIERKKRFQKRLSLNKPEVDEFLFDSPRKCVQLANTGRYSATIESISCYEDLTNNGTIRSTINAVDGDRKSKSIADVIESVVRSVCSEADKQCETNCNTNHAPPLTVESNCFTCNFCSYSTGKKSTLKFHMARHTGIGLRHCPHCSYKTAFHGNLCKHVRRHFSSKKTFP